MTDGNRVLIDAQIFCGEPSCDAYFHGRMVVRVRQGGAANAMLSGMSFEAFAHKHVPVGWSLCGDQLIGYLAHCPEHGADGVERMTKEAIVGRSDCAACGGSGSVPAHEVDGAGSATVPCSCAAQIMWDGRTLWVNGGDGSSIARLGPAGIDIHMTAKEQLDGEPQCLHCVGLPDGIGFDPSKRGRNHPLWNEFVTALRKHYGIEIPEDIG